MNKSCLQYARCPPSAWTVPLCVAALLAMTVTLSTESVPLARVWVAGTEPPVSPVSWNGTVFDSTSFSSSSYDSSTD